MIKHIYKVLSLVALTTLLLACRTERTTEQAEIVVTIAPLKYIIEQITANDFAVEILVPIGASPESFEPTPKQYISLNEAPLVFSTGLISFETALLEHIADKSKVVNLCHNISLIEGSCSHSHHHANEHHHGIDPHIWTSPRELKTMARNAYEAIIAQYPDSVKYTEAYEALARDIEQLDEECRQRCMHSSARAFIIYHPALTYYSRAYGIEQIALEAEGKEPSAKHIANVIEQAKAKHATSLLYQTEYPRSVVDILAEDTELTPQEINPLDENPIKFIREVTSIITAE